MNRSSSCDYDAVVIGGGFYGSFLAAALGHRLPRVRLIEKENDLMTRASYVNQARVHGGYHYPRSFMTALRSALNFPRFLLDFSSCIDDSFEKVYAIARQGSMVSSYQFRTFCRNIAAPVRPAPDSIRRLFNSNLIDEVVCVRECSFDAARLRGLMRVRLEEAGVGISLASEVRRILPGADGRLLVELQDGGEFSAGAIFNCAYSQINTILRNSELPMLGLKHELTELALIEPPDELQQIGVTVMDGPFFSTMPFPALGLHSLSHVRYTPHESWREPELVRDPHAYLAERSPESRFTFMLKDSQRYLPCMQGARYVKSLFEVKTVLVQNEVDDGRPILFRCQPGNPDFTTVLGAKIDNIYDVLDALNVLYATPAPFTHATDAK
jgi:glycine/D-amino acid oxidase-like deaminating enzyme